MIMADRQNDKNTERGTELFSECLAAMMYSDEEIRETMSPDDADEFIRLRNSLVAPDSSCEKVIGQYGNSDDHALPLAAEEEENYK
jgi:hypothetical protein